MRFLEFIIATVKDAVCYCGHPRNHHSRNGCTACNCPRKYMDW